MKNDPKGVRNRLLSRLHPSDYERLAPQLRPCAFQQNDVLYEAQSPIDFVYFPHDCVLSGVTMMGDGDGIEVGTIGNEGAAGLTAFLCPTISPNRLLVQVAGEALRIESAILEREARENRTLYDVLVKHHHAFMVQVTQSVACNGLHSLAQRCCRWLLMTHDRVEGDELPLTHEFLSFMLSVRRPGVTASLKTLQDRGLIANERGIIRIVDRAGLEAACCECYGIVVKQYEQLIGPA